MATRAKVACTRLGCGKFQPCPDHGFMADDRRELDRVAWRRLRARVLREEPFCLDCDRDGLTTRAVEVDHVDGNPANNSLSNLRPLCKSHHSRKTRSSGYNYRGQGENKLK